MLAPEDDASARQAVEFSLASDIVELVVLTADDTFLQTLRDVVGPARRLWHVPTSDKVSDLLIVGGVGILVLDVQVVHELGPRFIVEIKRQFLDLVVVVAGNREAETALAPLISDGTVYRFIHKPMSPARAKLFVDAAVKRYDEQRKQRAIALPVPAPRNAGLAIGIVCAALCGLLAGIWLSHHNGGANIEPTTDSMAPSAPAPAPRVPISARHGVAGSQSVLARAAQALTANRLTAPAGDNALESYRRALALDPGDPDARAGVAEVHERLLSRAENALLGERLDEAATDLDAARAAGADVGRVALLAVDLATARAQVKAAAALKRTEAVGPAAQLTATPALRASGEASTQRAAAAERAGLQADQYAALALESVRDDHLIEPDRDNARFYVERALEADPTSAAALEAEQQLALGLLSATRRAIERHDLQSASSWLDAAIGVASPDNLQMLRRALDSARREAELLDARKQLLKSAEDRLRDDRLLEPENDSAKYYLVALRSADPAGPALAQLTQELGARFVAKARSALTVHQYDSARDWLDEASAIGYAAPEAGATRRDLDTALAQQAFLANVVNASQLDLLKSVPPVYPRKAEHDGVEGWVELDFTLADSGLVKDIAVHAASLQGVFDQAAVDSLAQWRYKPVLRDGKPSEQRARIRIRFTVPH